MCKLYPSSSQTVWYSKIFANYITIAKQFANYTYDSVLINPKIILQHPSYRAWNGRPWEFHWKSLTYHLAGSHYPHRHTLL